TIAADGTLKGKVEELSSGHLAAEERSLQRHVSKPEYQKRIESWAAHSGSGAMVNNLEAADAENGRFRMTVDLETPRYARLMQDRLLVVRPAVLGLPLVIDVAETSRKHPVVLNA